MKQILMLSTGGTIACIPTECGLAPGLRAEEILACVPSIQALCDISCKTILDLDSANIQPEEWEMIAREVSSQLPHHDGIVILHGTDTMAYTASMLSFMLGNIDKPVILTGSQLPLASDGSDAPANLADAVRTALTGIQGVHIVFDRQIIQGTRAVKVRTVSRNAFESVNARPAGWVEGDQVRLAPERNDSMMPAVIQDFRYDPNVFLLKMIPGTRPDIFDQIIRMGYRGVVIEGFGLGGVPEKRRNIVEKLHLLVKKGLAVVLTTQCPYEKSDLSIYSVGVKANQAGIIPGMDMTSETAVTKLMWVLGHASDPAEIRRLMLTSFFGEVHA